MAKIPLFQLCYCEKFVLFFVLRDRKLNVYEFWAVAQTIWGFLVAGSFHCLLRS